MGCGAPRPVPVVRRHHCVNLLTPNDRKNSILLRSFSLYISNKTSMLPCAGSCFPVCARCWGVCTYTVCSFCCVGDFWRCYMGFISKLRLFSECFKIGKFAGLIACGKYLCGRLVLEDLPSKSPDFSVGAVYE